RSHLRDLHTTSARRYLRQCPTDLSKRRYQQKCSLTCLSCSQPCEMRTSRPRNCSGYVESTVVTTLAPPRALTLGSDGLSRQLKTYQRPSLTSFIQPS